MAKENVSLPKGYERPKSYMVFFSNPYQLWDAALLETFKSLSTLGCGLSCVLQIPINSGFPRTLKPSNPYQLWGWLSALVLQIPINSGQRVVAVTFKSLSTLGESGSWKPSNPYQLWEKLSGLAFKSLSTLGTIEKWVLQIPINSGLAKKRVSFKSLSTLGQTTK